MVSLGGFVAFWGWVFVLTTIAVWLGKKEARDEALKDGARSYGPVSTAEAEERGEARPEPEGVEADLGVGDTYRAMWSVLQKPAVRSLCVVLLTSKVGFAAADALSALKLQERGLKKEGLALMGVLVTPVALLVPAVVAKYTHGDRPLDVFMHAFPYRLAVGLLLAALVYAVPAHLTAGTASPPLYGAMLVCFVAHQAPHTARHPRPPAMTSHIQMLVDGRLLRALSWRAHHCLHRVWYEYLHSYAGCARVPWCTEVVWTTRPPIIRVRHHMVRVARAP